MHYFLLFEQRLLRFKKIKLHIYDAFLKIYILK